MNVEFLLYAKFDNKRVIPIRDRLFKAIVSSLNEVNINPLIMLSEYSVIENENTLIYSFHPTADPIYFEYKENTLFVTVSTGTFGAGYHKFIINILDRLSRRLDITFEENEDYKDPSGYFKERDFNKLKKFFIDSLADYSKMLLEHHDKGFGNFMIAMPYDYPIIEKEYFALSTLGYWGKNWFTDLIAANEEDKKVFAEDFFIWNDEEMNAQSWFKSLISMIWLYFPFREIIDDKEKKLYKEIIYSFEEAYKRDKNLRYPYNILIKVSEYLDDSNLVKFIEENKNNVVSNINIGFRTEKARYTIAGGFTMILPMRMNMNRSDKTLVEFRDINIYIAMQVYTFSNEETDIIMDYVIKQMDIADEDKGKPLNIKIESNDIKNIAYEKKLDNEDNIITVAAITNKLALLIWFTYNGEENREICLDAIKSIRIDD